MPDPTPLASEVTDRRFGGLDRLYGVNGAARISAAHVVVVGVGGVGSWTVEALARSGVGRLTLIDLDHVSESNINRQIQALDDTVGMAKVQALRQRIAHINPDCVVTCVEDFVEPTNWPSLLPDADVDAVIDACDQIKAKTAMAAWALQQRVLFITVGAAGGKRLAHQVDIDDLAHTSYDPLLAKLRYNLRRAHGAPREAKRIGIACVFSRESVAVPDASCNSPGQAPNDSSLNCSGYGSVVTVKATFGQCAAGWVLDQISSRPLQKHLK